MARPSAHSSEDLIAHLDALVKALEAWPPPSGGDGGTSFQSGKQSPDETSFGPVRLKFDDAFFMIGKWTLTVIQDCAEQAEGLHQMLKLPILDGPPGNVAA